MKKKFTILFATGLCLWAAMSCLRIAYANNPDLPQLWERYAKKVSFFAAQRNGPGKLVGKDDRFAVFMRESAWKYRAVTYELYFSSSTTLARSVYGLAMQSGDVDETMPLDRFERGVRGFHYSVAQVCTWINAIFANDRAVHMDEEHQLIRWLIDDGVIRIVDGKAVPGGIINHILGAAPGRKRSFETTLRHERLHVLWEEDAVFSGEYRKKWNAMSANEKLEVRKSLSAYSQSNEAQLMEEWAISQAENLSKEKVKNLVGL